MASDDLPVDVRVPRHHHQALRLVLGRAGLHTRATAATASSFLQHLSAHTPFPISAAQVDGGAEFHGAFEQQCRLGQIKLFVLPPRSPKLNGSDRVCAAHPH